MILFVSFLYHFGCVIAVVAWGLVGKMYPGVHNAEKPNGMLQIIFHVGTPRVLMRWIFKQMFDINMPNKYSNTIASVDTPDINAIGDSVLISINLKTISFVLRIKANVNIIKKNDTINICKLCVAINEIWSVFVRGNL